MKKDFTALRQELRALGWDEGAMSDQALRQSLDAATKRAQERREKTARELRRVNREAMTEFLSGPITMARWNGAEFADAHFDATMDDGKIFLDCSLKDLAKVVQSHFDLSEEATSQALSVYEDLVSAWSDRLMEVLMGSTVRSLKEDIEGKRDLLLLHGRDSLVEALTLAVDEVIAKSVQNL